MKPKTQRKLDAVCVGVATLIVCLIGALAAIYALHGVAVIIGLIP